MHITTHENGNLVELELVGLLDNNSAGHVAGAVEDVVRHGAHRVVLNLQGVTYLSSAGIAVLVRWHKELKALRGLFGVCDPSPQARDVLRLTGLEKMLVVDAAPLRGMSSTVFMTMAPQFRVSDQGGVAMELYDLAPREPLSCRALGNPELLDGCRFSASDCVTVPFGRDCLALGLGALGSGFEDCSDRFGEFLAVAGSAAQLPTHGPGAPDYELTSGDFIPSAQVLYGLVCEGQPSQLVRFDPGGNAGDSVPLSVLIDQCLTMTETELAAFTIVAECSGLIGATLRQSPVSTTAGTVSPLQYPVIRDWLSFTPEHAYARTLALTVGIAARRNSPRVTPSLRRLLRPLDPRGDVDGHFHAAAFPYRPLKKGRLDVQTVVASLFESEQIQGVLHLLADDRAISGAGESEFIRGGCWIGPITEVRA